MTPAPKETLYSENPIRSTHLSKNSGLPSSGLIYNYRNIFPYIYIAVDESQSTVFFFNKNSGCDK